MKLKISNNKISEHPEQFLRRAGYGFIRDRQRGKESYVRRLGGGHYPRLHMYVKQYTDNIVFDLHIDQKQTSYAGQHMHNAEYDGPVVKREISRLGSLLGVENVENRHQTQTAYVSSDSGQNVKTGEQSRNDVFRNIERMDYRDVISQSKVVKKSWWKFW